MVSKGQLLNCFLPGYHLKLTGHLETQIYGRAVPLSNAFQVNPDFGLIDNPEYSEHLVDTHPMFSIPPSQFVYSKVDINK